MRSEEHRRRRIDIAVEPGKIIPVVLTVSNYLSFLFFFCEAFIDSLPEVAVRIVGLYYVLSWLMALTLAAAMGTRFVQSLLAKKFDVMPILLVFFNLVYAILYWGNLLFFD